MLFSHFTDEQVEAKPELGNPPQVAQPGKEELNFKPTSAKLLSGWALSALPRGTSETLVCLVTARSVCVSLTLQPQGQTLLWREGSSHLCFLQRGPWLRLVAPRVFLLKVKPAAVRKVSFKGGKFTSAETSQGLHGFWFMSPHLDCTAAR